MRKLIKSSDGTLSQIAGDGLPTQLFCPVTSKSDDRCMDSCSWYHEMEYEGEATCYCQENEIGVRVVKDEVEEDEEERDVVEEVIALAMDWVYTDKDETTSIDDYIRERLKP